MGLPDAALDLVLRQDVKSLKHHPLVTSDIRSRNDSLVLQQLRKLLGIALEHQPLRKAGQADNCKYLPANLEAEFILPLQVLGSVRKGETELADGVEVHANESLSYRIESSDR